MVDNRVDANPRRMLARSLLLSPIGGRTKPDLAARGSGTHSGAPGHAHCGVSVPTLWPVNAFIGVAGGPG